MSKLDVIKTVLLCIASLSAKAQLDEKISSLKMPSSPAAVIIGVQPTSIASPKSWESLETALYTNFVDSNSNVVLPNSFAMEFTPYWATKNRKVRMKDFLTPSVDQSLIQNLSLSIASTKSFIVNDSVKSSGLGFGVRTMIWQGTKNEKELVIKTYNDFLSWSNLSTEVAIYSNKDNIKNLSATLFVDSICKYIFDRQETLLSRVDKKLRTQWIEGLKNYLKGKDSVNANLDDYLDDFTHIDTVLVKIEKYRADRKGFKLEIASAVTLNFPTNDIELSYASKYGLWLTPSFQPMGERWNWIEFLGVLRYYKYSSEFYSRFDSKKEYFSDNYDYGLKLALKWKKVSLDFEAVGRTTHLLLSQTKDANGNTITVTKSKSDSQLIATVSYKIDNNITLTYNFGKQFQPVLNYKGNLISVVNLSFGFGAPTRSNLDRF